MFLTLQPCALNPVAGGREESAPISVWRRLMVANELSEMQTKRITYPAFTLLMLVSSVAPNEKQSDVGRNFYLIYFS